MLAGSEKASATPVHDRLEQERVSLVQRHLLFFRLSLTVSPDPQTLQLARLVTDASRSSRSMSLRPFISQLELQVPSVTRGLTAMSVEEVQASSQRRLEPPLEKFPLQ